MLRQLWCACALLVLMPRPAAAHGSVPAPAIFTAPPRVSFTMADGGDRLYAPYPAPAADASFAVSFEDGDIDSAAHHVFYYLDHAPPLALTVAAVKAQAMPIPELAAGLWAACSCSNDLGFSCPDAGARACDNGFTWNTSGLPAGAYWVIAATADPPYDIYTVSEGPVRVAHGGPLPPAVLVLRPDGFGTFDTSYRTRWLLVGEPPFVVDLSYASDDEVRSGAAYHPIVTELPLVANVDGSFGYDWDVSALPGARIYHLRVSVTDASGLTTFSDSRAGVTVYHPGEQADLARPTDLGSPDPTGSGCAIAEHEPPGSTGTLWALALACLGVVGYTLRRAHR